MFNLFKNKSKKVVIQNYEYPTEEQLAIINPEVFKLNKVETWKYQEFWKKHLKCVSGKYGTIGGGISIEFMPTGLGCVVECKCHTCGEIEDITCTDNW